MWLKPYLDNKQREYVTIAGESLLLLFLPDCLEKVKKCGNKTIKNRLTLYDQILVEHQGWYR